MPTAVRAATDEYRRDQDIVGEWLAECCIMSPSYETEGPLLYRRYRTWCEDNGHRPSSNTVLGRRLSERSLTVRRSNGKRFWSGICLRGDHRSECSVDKGSGEHRQCGKCGKTAFYKILLCTALIGRFYKKMLLPHCPHWVSVYVGECRFGIPRGRAVDEHEDANAVWSAPQAR
jgi:hypothetical protein